MAATKTTTFPVMITRAVSLVGAKGKLETYEPGEHVLTNDQYMQVRRRLAGYIITDTARRVDETIKAKAEARKAANEAPAGSDTPAQAVPVEDLLTESAVSGLTKARIAEYAKDTFGVEVSEDQTKKEMVAEVMKLTEAAKAKADASEDGATD